MDFINRNVQQHGQRAAHAGTNGTPGAVGGMAVTGGSPKKHGRDTGRYARLLSIGTIALLISIAVLIGALAGYFALGNNGNESQYVNKNEYQAVFINVNGTNGGQVYFGHIQNLTSTYIDLTNVFYIQNQSSSSQSSSTSSSYTLIKLGCELHAPEDQMVINRSQVYFWENLKGSGQVAKNITKYYQNNPSGQNCSQASAASSTTQSTSNTQGSASTKSTKP